MFEKEINNVILFQIEQTSKIAKQYSQKEFDRLQLGITIEQWILLKIVEESKELSQKELAAKSNRDPASITRTLDLLGKKQLIERVSIPNNRRQYQVRLTENGQQFVQRHMSIIHEHRMRSTEGFSQDELESLRDMLLRIQANMK